MDDLEQWSLTSQAPGIGFTEDNFSTDRVVVVGMVEQQKQHHTEFILRRLKGAMDQITFSVVS